MAARKSTASQTPRNSKATKPTPPRTTEKPSERKRITTIPVWVVVGPDGDEVVYLSDFEAEAYSNPDLRIEPCEIEERVAVIVDQQASRVTSKERFGIMIGDRLVSTHTKLLKACEHMGEGYMVALMCNDKATNDEEWPAERRKLRRQTNPLAEKLAARYEAPLNTVAELLGEEIELHDPRGQTYDRKSSGGMRRATDRECELVDLDTAKHFTIDIRRDIAAQVVDRLTSHANSLLAAARRVKAAAKAGKIPRPASRNGKAVTA